MVEKLVFGCMTLLKVQIIHLGLQWLTDSVISVNVDIVARI